ncbi:MAG: glycosyltransferase family 2 protein, partial [Bacilli bacterium]
LDSDDYIDENMLEILLKNLSETDSDVSIAKILDCYGVVNKNTDNIVTEIYKNEEALRESLIARTFSVHAVAKLFKKDIIEKIRFREGITSEDALFMVEVFSKVKNVVYTNACVYYYLHRVGSISTASFNEKTLDVIKVWEENHDRIIESYPNLSELAHMRVVWAYFTALDRSILYLNLNDEIILNMVSFLKKQKMFTLHNKFFNKGRKISIFMLSLSKRGYRYIVKLHNNKINKLFD